jgi:hypothetical protein
MIEQPVSGMKQHKKIDQPMNGMGRLAFQSIRR